MWCMYWWICDVCIGEYVMCALVVWTPNILWYSLPSFTTNLYSFSFWRLPSGVATANSFLHHWSASHIWFGKDFTSDVLPETTVFILAWAPRGYIPFLTYNSCHKNCHFWRQAEGCGRSWYWWASAPQTVCSFLCLCSEVMDGSAGMLADVRRYNQGRADFCVKASVLWQLCPHACVRQLPNSGSPADAVKTEKLSHIKMHRRISQWCRSEISSTLHVLDRLKHCSRLGALSTLSRSNGKRLDSCKSCPLGWFLFKQ